MLLEADWEVITVCQFAAKRRDPETGQKCFDEFGRQLFDTGLFGLDNRRLYAYQRKAVEVLQVWSQCVSASASATDEDAGRKAAATGTDSGSATARVELREAFRE